MFRVHEEFPSHPKVEELEEAARDELEWLAAIGAWLIAGCDSRLRLEDGRVPAKRLRRLVGPKGAALAAKLVQVGLWSEEDGGYQFHDWGDVQETKEEVQDRRKRDRERKRRGGQKDSARKPNGTPLGKAEEAPGPPGGIRVESECDSGAPRMGGLDGKGGEWFSNDTVVEIFSALRAEAGHGQYKIKHTDYDRATAASDWAREECPGDPRGAVTKSVSAYLQHADDGLRDKNFPFWGWANDPGGWLARGHAPQEPLHPSRVPL